MVYECQHCDYVSQDLSNYKQHLEGVHGGAMYKCKICSKEFKWQRSLRRHMVLNHSFGASEVGLDGFNIGNAKSFTHNRAVDMVAPSHISNISSNICGKFDIRLPLGVNFIEDHDNVVNNITYSVTGQPMLVIFMIQ